MRRGLLVALKKLYKFFKKIDLTPRLIRLSEEIKKNPALKWLGFSLFMVIGLFGLIVPLLQGFILILVAFSFLGIKPLNKFIKQHRELMHNVSTIFFMITVGFMLFYGGSFVFDYEAPNPFEKAIDIIQFGKEDIDEVSGRLFNVVGLNLPELQRTTNMLK